MLEWVMLSLALIGALAASYTDLKHGIIPNKLTFSLFFAGIAGNVAIALISGDHSLIFDLGKAILATFALGYALWLLGGMAAGDVKEFLFLAALLPRYPEVLRNYFSPSLAWYPFPLSVFINTFVAIFPFLFIYAFAISIKKKVKMREFLEPLLKPGQKLKNVFYLAGAFSVGMLLGKGIAALGFIVLIFLLKKEVYRVAATSVALLLAIATGSAEPLAILRYYLLIAGVLLLFALFWNSLKILRASLKEEVKISTLEEGVIPAEEIYIRNGEIIREEKSILEKIKEYVNPGTMKRGTLIVGTAAAGLTEQQIATLRRLVSEGKLEDRIKIKARMPFAPAIFLGLLLALVFGDLSKMVSL
jgi:preflagellin peptidase FlaK